ncbi:hypothetical protein L2E82_03551 [Cichorium intybus]|uniref:Uncharacterized protein n=1 Tax=Cichorium intybus TaxID=13427 RepID=A0ACB9H4X4_CICIN|nr:hypothetical protein L2E82_03551 [Cichorium intybus]
MNLKDVQEEVGRVEGQEEGRGRARGNSRNDQQDNMQNQETKETKQIHVQETQAELVDEVVYETQTINDLRESGYNEDEIAKCVPPELVEEGIEETQPAIVIKR